MFGLMKVLFWSALAFTFVMAVIPPAHTLRMIPWDKAQHFLAFYTLMGLAAAAFPEARLWVLAALLSTFGAGIEIVQGLSFVHRDRDFWDWVADSVAILAVILPMLLVWWREGTGQRSPKRL